MLTQLLLRSHCFAKKYAICILSRSSFFSKLGLLNKNNMSKWGVFLISRSESIFLVLSGYSNNRLPHPKLYSRSWREVFIRRSWTREQKLFILQTIFSVFVWYNLAIKLKQTIAWLSGSWNRCKTEMKRIRWQTDSLLTFSVKRCPINWEILHESLPSKEGRDSIVTDRHNASHQSSRNFDRGCGGSGEAGREQHY